MIGYEKRDHFAHFLNAYISETIAAMNFKPGSKSRVPPTSGWAGQASASIAFEDCSFLPHFGGLLLRIRDLL